MQLGRLELHATRRAERWTITPWSDGAAIDVALHPTLDVAVARTAARTGEPVVFVDGDDGPVVVGALRTRATPGVDETEEVVIRATRVALEGDAVEVRGRRVAVEGDEQIALRSKAAFVVLRAASEIESFADRIVTRAEGVHKLVGRMLRLN